MTDTQVRAIRQLHADTTSGTTIERMTAQEMALIPHDLCRAATIAVLPDGRKFRWSEPHKLWVR